MKKGKITSIASLLLCGCTLLAGCGNSAPATTGDTGAASKVEKESESGKKSEGVTITYCNFNSSGGHEETLQKMYEAFHEENPDITVNIETIAYDDYFTQMQTRVAGGIAPDCYELNIENFAEYANKNKLAEIKGVNLSGLNDTAREAFVVDGKQYGLPESFSNVVLIYNKDLFDKAGVDYPTDSWTQDDLQKAAEAISKLDENTYGIYQPITYNEFFKVVAQHGGALLNEDKTEFTINSKENIEAAQLLVDRVLVSNVQPTEAQMGGMGDWDLFMSGRLGMIPTGIWAFQTFAENCDFDWDIVVEPGASKKATHFFSNACVINPDSENQEAATRWITWLTSSDKSAEIRLADGWDLPAIKNEDTLKVYLEQKDPENRQAVFDSLDYLVIPPVIEDYSMMSDIIGEKLKAAASGTMTVEEALNAAQKQCEEKVKIK